MRRGFLMLALVAALAWPGVAPACPFCGEGGKTLSQWGADTPLIVFGRLANANEDKDTTDLIIEEVIKDDEIRGKKTTLTLARYVDLSMLDDNKDRFVIFCDAFNGKFDGFKGVQAKKGSKLPEYLRGALKLTKKPNADRLRYFFDHLDSSELTVSVDAYWEFANADYKDFEPLVKQIRADKTRGQVVDKVKGWLKDPETPALRLGLYASILGHCGTEKDAPVLKEILDDSERRQGSGIDGMLAAYVLLDPKAGWKYLQESLKNTKEDFLFRYNALKAVRFLREYRSEVSKADLEAAACVLLTQDDVADLAIEDLRKWQSWDKADKVLGLVNTPLYKIPIIRRAILRYSLQAQDSVAAAKEHVAAVEKNDKEAVSQAKELLALEAEVRTKKPIDTTKKPVDTTKKK